MMSIVNHYITIPWWETRCIFVWDGLHHSVNVARQKQSDEANYDDPPNVSGGLWLDSNPGSADYMFNALSYP